MEIQNFLDHATDTMQHITSQQHTDRIISTFCKGAIMQEGGRGKAARETSLKELQELLEDGNEYRKNLRQQVRGSYHEKREYDMQASKNFRAYTEWKSLNAWNGMHGKTQYLQEENAKHEAYLFSNAMSTKAYKYFLSSANQLIELRNTLKHLKAAISDLSYSDRTFIPAPSHTGPKTQLQNLLKQHGQTPFKPFETRIQDVIWNHAQELYNTLSEQLRHLSFEMILSELRTSLDGWQVFDALSDFDEVQNDPELEQELNQWTHDKQRFGKLATWLFNSFEEEVIA